MAVIFAKISQTSLINKVMKSENLILAEDINTKAEKLRELAKTDDEKVLAAIVRNPNTPVDLLIELAGECLEEIIGENIALDLILFEYPTIEKIWSDKQ